MWEVLETAKKVAEKSSQVMIDEQALAQFSQRFIEKGIKAPSWEESHHFHGNGEDMVSYLLVLDTVNFCFWPVSGTLRWEIEYRSQKLSGYYALAASLKRAMEAGLPITRAEYLGRISFEELKAILGGQGEIQLLEYRLQNLNELGRVLGEAYSGRADKLVEAAGHSAAALVRLLAEKLPSFRDVAHYGDDKVFFYKRAQLFAADLYGAFQGKEWGEFIDIDKLTAFADYKVPQVLRHLGILQYTEDLAQKVDHHILLVAGGPEEVEIRANTVWAVELIRQEMSRKGKNVRAFELDWLLWNLGQQAEFRIRPYHRTVTIFY